MRAPFDSETTIFTPKLRAVKLTDALAALAQPGGVRAPLIRTASDKVVGRTGKFVAIERRARPSRGRRPQPSRTRSIPTRSGSADAVMVFSGSSNKTSPGAACIGGGPPQRRQPVPVFTALRVDDRHRRTGPRSPRQQDPVEGIVRHPRPQGRCGRPARDGGVV